MQKVQLEVKDKYIPLNILEEIDVFVEAGDIYEVVCVTYWGDKLISYSIMDSWGNVYCILNEEWFSKYFTITGDISTVAEYI